MKTVDQSTAHGSSTNQSTWTVPDARVTTIITISEYMRNQIWGQQYWDWNRDKGQVSSSYRWSILVSFWTCFAPSCATTWYPQKRITRGPRVKKCIFNQAQRKLHCPNETDPWVGSFTRNTQAHPVMIDRLLKFTLAWSINVDNLTQLDQGSSMWSHELLDAECCRRVPLGFGRRNHFSIDQ